MNFKALSPNFAEYITGLCFEDMLWSIVSNAARKAKLLLRDPN